MEAMIISRESRIICVGSVETIMKVIIAGSNIIKNWIMVARIFSTIMAPFSQIDNRLFIIRSRKLTFVTTSGK